MSKLISVKIMNTLIFTLGTPLEFGSFIGTADVISSMSSTLITVISNFGFETFGRFVVLPSGTNHGLYFVPLFGNPKQFSANENKTQISTINSSLFALLTEADKPRFIYQPRGC